ncbi:MAG TPA: 50S ribosomal protein L24 [Gammaproteobacteria bacterium]|nr:50S ribosomal protein L24 [Gammaproteobacteria bacterium]
MRKIKKGDTVIVITGKSKGKTGKVLSILPELNKALVEGVNMVKRATKPNPRANKPGGIIEKEAKINLSNIAIYNPIKQKADKVKIKFLNDGKKVRHFKSDDELIDI